MAASRPSTRSATCRADAGPVVMPHGPWPEQRNSPSTHGTRPTSGRPSAARGRAQARVSRIGASATAGTKVAARARIRKHDYLTPEADVINEMLGTLEDRIAGVEEQAAAIRAVFADLKRVRHGGSPDGLDESIRTLGVLVDSLQARLEQFRKP